MTAIYGKLVGDEIFRHWKQRFSLIIIVYIRNAWAIVDIRKAWAIVDIRNAWAKLILGMPGK